MHFLHLPGWRCEPNRHLSLTGPLTSSKLTWSNACQETAQVCQQLTRKQPSDSSWVIAGMAGGSCQLRKASAAVLAHLVEASLAGECCRDLCGRLPGSAACFNLAPETKCCWHVARTGLEICVTSGPVIAHRQLSVSLQTI